MYCSQRVLPKHRDTFGVWLKYAGASKLHRSEWLGRQVGLRRGGTDATAMRCPDFVSFGGSYGPVCTEYLRYHEYMYRVAEIPQLDVSCIRGTVNRCTEYIRT